MLLVPEPPRFQWKLHTGATRPTTASGALLTPGNNVKGSYVELIDGALVTNDVWGIQIILHQNFVAATVRQALVDIAIDTTAGTSYSVVIPDLLEPGAGNMTGGTPPTNYYFPLFIPAGSSIAARASVNNATVGTLRCSAILFGKPKFPERAWAGSKVQALGVTAATSGGTIVTSGVASEGAWTSLGTLSRNSFYWQCMMAANDTTMTTQTYAVDLGRGSAGAQQAFIEDELFFWTSNESVSQLKHPAPWADVPAGETIWGRMQVSSATADSNLSIAAYAVS